MRCPSCGTDIAPDSRFCGGCGAKVVPGRVAPTIKLENAGLAPASVSAPPPNVIPTPAPGAMMRPATNPAATPRVSHPQPAASAPSMSMPVPARRPIGLIVLVLLLDLGLGTAGAVMLGKGLAKPVPEQPAAKPTLETSGSGSAAAR